MTRWPFQFTAALTGGAILSIAIAWALAAYAPFPLLDRAQDEYIVFEWDTWNNTNLTWWNDEYPFGEPAASEITINQSTKESSNPPRNARITPFPGNRLTMLSTAGLDACFGGTSKRSPSEIISVRGHRIRSGMPFKCMTSSEWSRRTISRPHFLPPSTPQIETEFVAGIPLTVSRESDHWQGLTFFIGLRVLPLKPLWPGFLANTLFYALLLWLLFFAPFTLRRLIRRRRWRCEDCAYPIGTSSVCTECGEAIGNHATPSAISAPSVVNSDTR